METRYRERLLARDGAFLFWTNQAQTIEQYQHFSDDTLTVWLKQSNRYSRATFQPNPHGGIWPDYCGPDCLHLTKRNLLAAVFHPPIEDTKVEGGVEDGYLWVSYESLTDNIYRLAVKYVLDPETFLPVRMETETIDNGANLPTARRKMSYRFRYLKTPTERHEEIDSFRVPPKCKLLSGQNSIIDSQQGPSRRR
jgi:hypothetical protein